jgi:hypothetical protein
LARSAHSTLRMSATGREQPIFFNLFDARSSMQLSRSL